MPGLSTTSRKLLPVDQHDTECSRHVPAQTGSALGRGEAVCHGQRRSQHNSGQAPKWDTTQNVLIEYIRFLMTFFKSRITTTPESLGINSSAEAKESVSTCTTQQMYATKNMLYVYYCVFVI